MLAPPDFWARWGIRKQLTAVAVTMVAVPLLVGIVVLANLLTNALANAQSTAAHEVAHRTAMHVAAYGGDSLPGELVLDEGFRAQVLDSNGKVLWTSHLRYRTPLSSAHPAPGEVVEQGKVAWWGPGDRNEHRDLVVAQGVKHDGQYYVAVVATSQEEQHSAVTLTVALLLAAVPLAMLLAGLTAWWVAGRALRTVDEINQRVEGITSSTLDERVPVPPSQDEVRDLALTMNQMLGRLEHAQNTQQHFISDASHELRSPLASLTGALEIASMEDSLDTWREMSPLMRDETARLNQLVQGLLELSRGDDGGVRLSLTEVDLDDLAVQEAARLRSTFDLEVTTAITARRVMADPAKLGQVLRNLCDNAARHAKSRIEVGLGEGADGGALLWVGDDGNGVAPGDRERVFQRFVRLEESRSRDEGGSGLGLAIVSQLVTAHGGHVRVTDSQWGGARFEVWLPAAE